MRGGLDEQVLPTFADRLLPVDTAVVRRSARPQGPEPQPERDGLIAATALTFARPACPLLNPWDAPDSTGWMLKRSPGVPLIRRRARPVSIWRVARRADRSSTAPSGSLQATAHSAIRWGRGAGRAIAAPVLYGTGGEESPGSGGSGCQVTPGGPHRQRGASLARYVLTESATESKPPKTTLRPLVGPGGGTARVKRCGKSAPRPWQQGWHGKPHLEQGQIGKQRVAATQCAALIRARFRVGCWRSTATWILEE